MAGVQVISDNSKREDGYGQAVAAVARVSAEELGDDFIVVFCIYQPISMSPLPLISKQCL